MKTGKKKIERDIAMLLIIIIIIVLGMIAFKLTLLPPISGNSQQSQVQKIRPTYDELPPEKRDNLRGWYPA